MIPVVLVHGIWNRQPRLSPRDAASALALAARESLTRGLARSGVAAPEVAMAYYAHLLTDEWAAETQSTAPGGDRFEELSAGQLAEAAEWLALAGAPAPDEPQADVLIPVRWSLDRLVRMRVHGEGAGLRERLAERLERLIVASLRESDAYTSRPGRRQQARTVVADAVRAHRPRVLVAHSLGSVVAYEALHAHPDLSVDLFLTLGSPLGLPALMRKLEPEPRAGHGARPPGVRRWVNVADRGDLVALPIEFGGRFPVDAHGTARLGLWDPHTLGGYLSDATVADAIAAGLAA